MITYTFGPFTGYVWGTMIALGIASMLFVLHRRVKGTAVSWDRITDLAAWVVAGAFIGARLSHVFFYQPTFFLSHPLEIFKVWNGGLSSLGGIIVGTCVALWYVRQNKLSVTEYGDALMRSMPIAWTIGRFGCFLESLHPGVRSEAWFAVAYPDGRRLDLGIIESLFWLLLAIYFSIYRSRVRGWYFAMLPLLYAPVRFALDYLRARDTLMPDARYFGLTPAQYGMIVLFGVGVALATHYRLFKKTV